MAYDKRDQELMRRLDKAQKEDKAITADEAKALEAGWLQWLAARKALLGDLAALVTDSSKDRTDQEKEWRAKVDAAFDGLIRNVMDVLSSFTGASENAKKLAQATLVEENGFLNGLEGLGVAARRDALVAYPAVFAKSTADLEAKWALILGDNVLLLDEERKVTDALRRMVDDTVTSSARLYRSGREAAREVGVKLAEKAGSALGAAGAAGLTKAGAVLGVLGGPAAMLAGAGAGVAVAALKEMGEKWVKYSDDVGTRIQEFRQLMKRQSGGVFIGFRHARETTEEFVKTNGYDLVKDSPSLAASALDTWIGAMPSDASGMRADGAELKGVVVDALKGYLNTSEQAYRDFVLRYRDKFLGPVGPDLRTSMVEMTEFDRYSGEITAKARNVHDLIKQFNSESNTFWVIDITSDFAKYLGEGWSALKQEQRDQIKKELDAQQEYVLKEIKARVDEVINANVLVARTITSEQIAEGWSKAESLKELVG